MSNYNYFEAVKDDVKDRLGDYDPRGEDETLEEYRERLHESFWIDDSVTGNGSGSLRGVWRKSWRADRGGRVGAAGRHRPVLLPEPSDWRGGD